MCSLWCCQVAFQSFLVVTILVMLNTFTSLNGQIRLLECGATLVVDELVELITIHLLHPSLYCVCLDVRKTGLV